MAAPAVDTAYLDICFDNRYSMYMAKPESTVWRSDIRRNTEKNVPEIYEEPNSRFVAGFVGKAAFFPVKVTSEDNGRFKTLLDGREVDVHSAAPDVKIGDDAVIMARPESLRLVDKGEGKFDAKVKLNVYLGNSIETFLETDFGEVLVEIDDPKVKKVYGEGEDVSVDFDPGRVRLLGISED